MDRRRLLCRLPALAAVTIALPAAAMADTPNNDLLLCQMVAEFKRLSAIARAGDTEMHDLQHQARASFAGRKFTFDQFCATYYRIGGDDCEERQHAAWNAADAQLALIQKTRAVGIVGVWAKLKAYAIDNSIEDVGPREDQDLGVERFNILMDEVSALAGPFMEVM